MQTIIPLDEVRGALDEMTAVLGRFLVDNFDFVRDEVLRYDPYKLLKYLRDQLVGTFVEHVSQVTDLGGPDAASLARTLINMGLQIRNRTAHFNADIDPLQINTPTGAIAAIGCLVSLARVFGVDDTSPEISSMNNRIHQLVTMYSMQIAANSDATVDVSRRKPRRPSTPTVIPAASSFELLVESALNRNRRIYLDEGLLPVILGRDVGDTEEQIVDLSEFAEAPGRISRRHCELSGKDGVIYVKDLGSSNGTLLNDQDIHAGRGRPGKPYVFESGDVLHLGDAVELKLLRKGK